MEITIEIVTCNGTELSEMEKDTGISAAFKFFEDAGICPKLAMIEYYKYINSAAGKNNLVLAFEGAENAALEAACADWYSMPEDISITVYSD